MKINIPKEINYLGEFITDLPKNCIFDKGKVGCGGTTVAINNPENYIICVPFVSLIKNKLAQHNNLFGFYEKVSIKELKAFIKNGGNKIMVTYDSLEKLISYINPLEYNLLIDELHILFLQYSFRRNAVQKVLPNYTKFKSFCFMTATPVENDFMLEELKNLPIIEAVWTDVKEVTVNSVKCEKDVKGTVINIVEKFLSGKYEGNGYFFVNSVEFIREVAEFCGLTDDTTRVIYSDNNKTQLLVKRGYTTDPTKKINFVTSTAFEGADIYDEQGRIYIISDNKKPHTLTDISTQFQQIAGRIRNTKYWNTITHIFTETRYYNNLTYEEFKTICGKQVDRVESKLVQLGNLDQDLRKDVMMPLESYVVKEDDLFSFDPNLVKIDLYNFKITKCLYKLRVNVVKALRTENFTVKEFDSSIKNPIIDVSKVEMSFKDVVEELEKTEDEEFKLAAYEKYPFLENAIEKIGFDGIKKNGYVITNIKRALIKFLDVMTTTKIAKLLKLSGKLNNGVYISAKDAKELVAKYYKEYNVEKSPNIKDFYEVKEKTKYLNNTYIKGYIIIIPKILLEEDY
jgi:hypothetical protein